MKIITGAALLAAFTVGMIATGGSLAMLAAAMYMSTAVGSAVILGVASIAAGLVMGGIAEMLYHTPGSAIAARNPIAPWQVIYGQQMVGGTIVDIGETGSHEKFLHMIIVTAAHQCQSFDGLWLDGKQVWLAGDPLSGCSDDGGTHYDLSGLAYNHKGRVYAQAFLGSPTQAACQDYITRSDGHWTSAHTLSGRSYIYLRLTYDTSVFPSGMPQVKTLWKGKNDILDTRDSTRKYTTNAALCVADFLQNQDYGLHCAPTEINQTALIAAANLCDTYTVTGTIEPLYALNGVFNLASNPGEIINNMLSACAGQISYNAGQFSIYAAGWRGASCALDQTDLLAPIKYRPKRKVRELYNCVRGTFLSPYGPIVTRGPGVQIGQINPWDGQWQYTDTPEYAEDVAHGYTSNAWLDSDGQNLYLNTKFPFTISVSTCQRLAKIMLERNRQQGSGTLQCSLSAYGIQPLDIIQFSYPRFGWVDKLFEVSATRLTMKSEDGKPPVPVVELDIVETDPRVYSWAGEEEKNLAGQAGPLVPSTFVVVPPTGLTLTDDATTAIGKQDGTSMARLLLQWTAPMDPYVTSGGAIQIQYQTDGVTWVDVGTVSGDANYKYIDNIATNALITVRIRSVRASGSTSDWLTAARTASNVGIPAQVSTLSATESPFKTDAGMRSLVSVAFVPPPDYYGSAEVYLTGYNGCATPQLVASGVDSPIEVLVDTTHETVMVTVLAVSPNNITADKSSVPAVWVALDGVQSAPPMPSIAQAQSALPDGSGWQFVFNVLGGLLADQISSYRIYHSENPSTTSPDYYETKVQPPTNVGSITVQESTGDLLYYWVSAISTSGIESMLNSVPFQYVDPGAPPPSSLTAVATTQTYRPSLLTNGWAINTHKQYCEPQDSYDGSTFGPCKLLAYPYSNPGNTFDGNQSTACTFTQTHSAHYGGCEWSFPGVSAPTGATITGVTLSITSDVLATSGISGEASVWYSTNGGATYTAVYVCNAHPGPGRTKQTDTIALSTTVTLANLRVMANAHGHDDICHNIYEISLAIAQSSYAGPEKVTGVSAKLVSGNVQIGWSGLIPLSRTDLINYQVYRNTHGGGYTTAHLQYSASATGAATYSWTDPQAHDGSFDYWVVAQSHTGYGPSSDVATLYSGGSLLYANGMTAEDLRPAAFGADPTAAQSIVYTGTTESIVPNGDFLLGNIQGWFMCETGLTGPAAFAWTNWGGGLTGLQVNGGGYTGVGSQTFRVIPGQKYRIMVNAWAGSGTQSVYFRINYSATYLAQITQSNRTGLNDFLAAGSIATTATLYSYDWTCPAGVNYANLGVYQWGGSTANIAVTSVACIPYASAAQWGADVTSSNVSSGTRGHVIFMRPSSYTNTNALYGTPVGDAGSSLGNVVTFSGGWVQQITANASTGFGLGSYDVYVRLRTFGNGNSPTSEPFGVYDNTAAVYLLNTNLSGLTTSFQEIYAGRVALTSSNINNQVRTFFGLSTLTTTVVLDYIKFVPTPDYNNAHSSIQGALDNSGNLKLKNRREISGLTVSPSISPANTWIDLPELNSSNPSMASQNYGNPCLLGGILQFSTISGVTTTYSVITSINFSAGSAVGLAAPGTTVTISGDGTGASATITWATTGTITTSSVWTPTIHLIVGTGYTYATATVTVYVPGVTTYYGQPSGSYTCTMHTYTSGGGVATLGLEVHVQVLLNGSPVVGPISGATNSNGEVSFPLSSIVTPPAGYNYWDVQVLVISAYAVYSISRSFQLIELG